MVPARLVVGARGKVRQTWVPLRPRRAASVPVSGPESRGETSSDLCPQGMAGACSSGRHRLPADARADRGSLRAGMEAARAKEEITVLRRLIAYSEKIFHLSRDVVAPLSDRRPEPRISTAAVVNFALGMFWARIGSLNALELAAGSRFWKTWLGEPACSADTVGRVHALLDPAGLRQG